jgi:multicomponent Na+:H+ antiporter subunit B
MKNEQQGMTLIVKTITRLTVGLILIYGIFVTLRSHVGPGGGFAGGIIVALSFIHIMLAYGKEGVLRKINQARCIFLMSLGAIIFLVITSFGFIDLSKHFTSNRRYFEIFSNGLFSLVDVAVALMVGTGLFAIFLVLISAFEAKEGK